jgi:hypothetical protein
MSDEKDSEIKEEKKETTKSGDGLDGLDDDWVPSEKTEEKSEEKSEIKGNIEVTVEKTSEKAEEKESVANDNKSKNDESSSKKPVENDSEKERKKEEKSEEIKEKPKLKIEYGHKDFSELPLYPQVSNGCGLATLLMNVNPDKNSDLKGFLDGMYKSVAKTLPFSEKIKIREFKWAYALQTLLMKSLAYGKIEFLYEFLEEKMEYSFEDQRFINRAACEGYMNVMVQKRRIEYLKKPMEDYLENGYMNYFLLDNFIKVMKTDLELKVLMELFDYQFEYQDALDLFGAIVFEAPEVRKPTQDTKKKLELLFTKLADPDYRFFFGIAHHWVALTSLIDASFPLEKQPRNGYPEGHKIDVRKIILRFNDPNTVKISNLLLKNLNGSCRIYVFKKRNQDLTELHKKIVNHFEKELEEEIKILGEIQESVQKKFDKGQPKEEGNKQPLESKNPEGKTFVPLPSKKKMSDNPPSNPNPEAENVVEKESKSDTEEVPKDEISKKDDDHANTTS